MSKNIWMRSVSFNKKDPKDIARLNLIGRKSYSKFIKRLLDEEIKRQALATPTSDQPQPQPQPQQRVVASTSSRTLLPKQQKGMQGKPRMFNPMLGDR